MKSLVTSSRWNLWTFEAWITWSVLVPGRHNTVTGDPWFEIGSQTDMLGR